jgi:asparagine synthase (glutamine-hydrolysing)
MCGIAGMFLRPGASVAGLGSVLQRMNDVQRHRGPDGEGVWTSPERGIGFGHTRLAILDLSPAGAQPMHSADSALTIVFNGEIYNFADLRARLELHGATFRTRTDTEVLLEGYRQYGTDVLVHLRGMFAFAIFDARDGTLFCARDRIGKKPFVYTESAAGFAFASEIPAVLSMPDCHPVLNHEALAAMLLHNMRHIPDPHTVYRGISRLRPGHALIARAGRIERVWRYWQPHADQGASTPQRLRAILEEAVELRRVADVPVGALLSGGVDSSAIAALMQQRAAVPIKTYALGADPDDEDLHRARRMAERLGCEHKELYFEPERQLRSFRALLATYGEPIMLLPLVHTYELCRAIREDGISVVLAGHGADELFCGYTGHLRVALASRWLGATPALRPLWRALPPEMLGGWAGLMGARPGSRKAALYRRAEATWDVVLNPQVRPLLPNLAAEEATYWGSLTPSAAYIEESNFVALLVESTHSVTIAGDLPAMLASVEVRAPFLDQDLIAFALGTPLRSKVGGWTDARRLKQILKTAVEDLVPRDLLYAPKRGFGMGIQERMVLAGPWRKEAEELFTDADPADGLFDPDVIRRLWTAQKEGTGEHTDLLAKLFAIQSWLRMSRERAWSESLASA